MADYLPQKQEVLVSSIETEIKSILSNKGKMELPFKVNESFQITFAGLNRILKTTNAQKSNQFSLKSKIFAPNFDIDFISSVVLNKLSILLKIRKLTI